MDRPTDKTEARLLIETEKWLERLKTRSLELAQDTKETREQLTNLRAYISDCSHFLENKDYVRAFEAIMFAWGIYETLQRLGLLKGK